MTDTTPRQMPWQTGIAVALPAGVFAKHEEWAWANIIRGRLADMARYPGDEADASAPDWWSGTPCADEDIPDPAKPESFKPWHTLSEMFLRTVIFHEPFASAPERPGVRIEHARVTEAINWSGRATRGELWLDKCRFENRIIVQDLVVAGILSFDGAVLEMGLDADRLTVQGHMFCGERFHAGRDVRLLSARIGGKLTFSGGHLMGVLQADGVVIDHGLTMREMTRLGSAQLIDAKIGGNLQLSDSTLEGQIDLTGAAIEGALELAQAHGSEPVWGEEAELILRNARLGALAGSLDAFRRIRTGRARRAHFPKMDLVGLRYANLGGLQAEQKNTLAGARAADLAAFIDAGSGDGRTFTPGPFRTLAKELRESGHEDKARYLTRAMMFHERRCAGGLRALSLHLSGILTGFGFRNFYALIWFFLLVAGAAAYGLHATHAVFAPTLSGAAHLAQWGWFSLGNAIPLMTLDEAHKTFLATHAGTAAGDVPLDIASVFYGAKIAGFLILTYLAASVSGLANKADK